MTNEPRLPAPPARLIGRAREVARVCALLRRADRRLVTLTGTGGAGKTRLALEVARRLVPAFPDGVRLVDLAPLHAPDLLPTAVAAALGLEQHPTGGHTAPMVEHLAEYLRQGRRLLVLDNCEHLVDACARFAASLLAACPGLHILATSREPLRVAGEVTYAIPPLTAPDPERLPALDRLEEYSAVRLFAERVRLSRDGFALTADNAPQVAAICHRVGGLPLALELAAARARTLPLETIAARLDDALGLLTRGSRPAPPRHQTLRAALDWSQALLTPDERVLFRRLAVFAGGWTPGAADQVCGDAAGCPLDVPDLLSGLVDKSLVVFEADGGRYRLLEPVRQYAAEQLEAAGETEQTRCRQLEWCLGLAEEAEPHLEGPEQPAWLARLDAERANLRVALRHAVEHGLAGEGLRLTTALHRFWEVRAAGEEAAGWAEAFLGAEGRAPAPAGGDTSGGEGPPALLPGPRARALQRAAWFYVHRGEHEGLLRARVLLDAALGLARRADAAAVVASCLNALGFLAYEQGDLARAAALLEQSLAEARRIGDGALIAQALAYLSRNTHARGDLLRSEALLAEAAVHLRARGDLYFLSWTLTRSSLSAHTRGDFVAAAAHNAECLPLFRTLGDRLGEAYVLESQGTLAHWRGRYTEADAWLTQAVALRREIGWAESTAATLRALAVTAISRGQYARAAALLEESLALAERRGDAYAAAVARASLADLAAHRGEYASATTLYEAALGVYRRRGTAVNECSSLLGLALVAQAEGDHTRAAARCAEALQAAREMGHRRNEVRALAAAAGAAAARGDHAAARAGYAEALALCRQIGDQRNEGAVLRALGTLAAAQADHAEAEARLEESLALYRRQGDLGGEALALRDLGDVAAVQGNAATAGDRYARSLALLREADAVPEALATLERIAALAERGGDAAGAAGLRPAAAAAREAAGILPATLPPWLAGAAQRDGAAFSAERRAVEALPPPPTEASAGTAPSAGRAAKCLGGGAPPAEALAGTASPTKPAPQLVSAIDYGLRLAAAVPRGQRLRAPNRPGRQGGRVPGLTPREREVAALVARGLTNRQIARALVVTEGTAGTHVERIFKKLGAHSRAEVGAWAATHGLLPQP
jgi:predicted ATPase/DNA-binding CsgD family transcriptional regulator